MSAVKQAEDNDDLVIRCYESNRVGTEAVIRLPKWNRKDRGGIRAKRDQNLSHPENPEEPVKETNLMEWDLEEGSGLK